MNNLTVRRLKPVEYEKLLSVSDGYTPDPNRSVAVVAENGHHIMGRIFLMAPAHVEGVFVEPAWRNTGVMRQLVDAIELEARAEGISKVLAYAKDPDMYGRIEAMGYKKLPWTVWEKELK
jgi:GNAT superfamily N-acetyltransferase